MICWVTYQRGSLRLKERYASIERAHERSGQLIADVLHLRVISEDDVEGLAGLAYCRELPPILSNSF